MRERLQLPPQQPCNWHQANAQGAVTGPLQKTWPTPTSLTGLINRRFFLAKGRSGASLPCIAPVNSAIRRSISILGLHFKKINDHLWPRVGDKRGLIAFAELAQKYAR